MIKFWKSRKDLPNSAVNDIAPQTIAKRSSLPAGFTSEDAARSAILAGRAPEGLWTGTLRFEREPNLVELPKGLTATHIFISDCPNFRRLPENLWTQCVSIHNCPAFGEIPASVDLRLLEVSGSSARLTFAPNTSIDQLRLSRFDGELVISEWLVCPNFSWPNSPLKSLPAGLRVTGSLDLRGSRELVELTESLSVEQISLRGCSKLARLPNKLEARTVDVSGCTRLQWQDDGFIEVRRLNISDCPQIMSLPWWLFVEESIDVANTGLTDAPSEFAGCQWLWRDVRINSRIAFHPEQITVKEIFDERNTEVRRIMIERFGFERFFVEANPQLCDRDLDPGGERRLLRVPFRDMDDIYVLSVSCPSNARRYFIRVPPYLKSCHQAAAWIAGFDDPKEYEPVVET